MDSESSSGTQNQQLQAAARAKDRAAVHRLLAAGQFSIDDLTSALAGALWYGDVPNQWPLMKEIAELLLEHGADPNGHYSTYGPIVFGTGECLVPESLEWLLATGADVTFPPIDTKYGMQCPLSYWLGTYARGRNARKHRGIEILLRHQAFIPQEVTAPILAIHRGDAKELDALLKQDPGLVKRRFPEMPYGNIELRGASLLHCAVEFDEIECVKVLLDHHADINLPSEQIEGIGGQTAIFHAIGDDAHVETLQYLVQRVGAWMDLSLRATWRANGEIQSKPMTPLEYAESRATENARKWRKRLDEELNLLRSLDRTAQIKSAILAKDIPLIAELLEQHPELLTPRLWPVAMHQASSPEITRFLLTRGLDPNQCSAPRKPLHFAVAKGWPEIVEALLAAGAEPNIRDGEGFTPLDLFGGLTESDISQACKERIIQLLQEAGAELNVWTLLRIGETERALATLEAEPELIQHKSPDLGFRPLHVAARMANVQVVRWLIEHGADINDGQNTPLWFAAQSSADPADRIAVMKLLLEAGASIDKRCENETTPLHFAAWRGPSEVVKFLLDQDAPTWLGDDQGKLPIDYAIEFSSAPDKEVTIGLLSRIQIENPEFRAAVTAIDTGNLEELKKILQSNPSLVQLRAEEAGEFGGDYFTHPTLLHFVANNPYRRGLMPPRILESTCAILDAGAEIDATTLSKDSPSTTLALVASCEPARKAGMQIPLLELLVSRGADPKLAMHAAVVHNEIDAVKTLIRLGAPHDLHSSAALGETSVLQTYLKPANEAELANAAHRAVSNQQMESLRLLLEAGVSIDARSEEHPFSPTLLHEAAWNGHSEVVEWLLQRGADPRLRDSQFKATPAGWAEHNQHPTLAKFLQTEEEQATDDIVQAVLENKLHSVIRILNHHPEKIATTGGKWDKPLLHCAAHEGHVEVLRELVLNREVDVNLRCESDHACAIHFAAGDGRLAAVQALAELGADLEAPDNDHQLNVLGWATSMSKCHPEVAEFLLSRGVQMSIWSAISLNRADAVKRLIEKDPAILQSKMSRNEYFRTPLHHAVESNQIDMVRLLLELGADAAATDALGLTPIATGKPSSEILTMLSDKRSDLTLHELLVLGRFKEAERMLSVNPTSIRAGGDDARLFVYAMVKKNWPMAEWLLAHGGDVNALAEVYSCRATALHFLVEQGNLERIQWLIEQGANTTIRDGSYDADALGWAEFFGNEAAAKLILAARKKSAARNAR